MARVKLEQRRPALNKLSWYRVALVFCASILPSPAWAQTRPAALQADVDLPFHFIAYGDTRFTNPSDTKASNPEIRRLLVDAIAEANPAFISIGGDISYNGYDASDWQTWDKETAAWRQQKIPIYPALGNHDLHGDSNIALANYFQRFPALDRSRYYSVRAANLEMLVLDSSLDETSGSQGEWLNAELDHLAPEVSFVVIVLHHPPYTSSSDKEKYGGGHSARKPEQLLAAELEERQKHTRARFVVIAGHVHNYERHEHGGITYFVTGGGGAHAYPIERSPNDPFPDTRINYHYINVDVDSKAMKFTMNRVEIKDGRAIWTQPDSAVVAASAPVSMKAASK